MEKKRVFVREATGLVREGGLLSGLSLNVGWQGAGPLLGLIFAVAYISVAMPGFEPITTLLLSIVFAIPICLTYSTLMSNMPRSGGEYVANSRIIHPAIGFALSFGVMTVNALSIGFMVVMTFSFTIGPPLAMAGWVLKNDMLYNAGIAVQNPNTIFLLGTIYVVIIGLIVLSGTKNTFRSFSICFVIALIGFVAAMIAVSMHTVSDFIPLYNQYMSPFTNTPDPYHEVISQAASEGFTVPAFGIVPTILGVALVLNYINIWSPQGTSYLSGEIKNAGSFKRQIYLSFGGNILAMIPLVLMTFFLLRAVGYDFLSAVTYMLYSGAAFPVPPYPTLFITMLSPPVIALLFAFTSMLWTTPYNVGVLTVMTRIIFAWSFDRVTPSKLADVSDRVHVPVYTVVLCLVLAEVFLYLATYAAQLLALYSVGCFIFLVSTILATSISCLLFPYRNKDLYNVSTVKKYDLGKIPFAAIVGAISTLVTLWVMLVLIQHRTTLFYGWSDISIVESVTIPYIIGLAFYYIARVVRARQHIDMGLAFKEIPPE